MPAVWQPLSSAVKVDDFALISLPCIVHLCLGAKILRLYRIKQNDERWHSHVELLFPHIGRKVSFFFWKLQVLLFYFCLQRVKFTQIKLDKLEYDILFLFFFFQLPTLLRKWLQCTKLLQRTSRQWFQHSVKEAITWRQKGEQNYRELKTLHCLFDQTLLFSSYARKKVPHTLFTMTFSLKGKQIWINTCLFFFASKKWLFQLLKEICFKNFY